MPSRIDNLGTLIVAVIYVICTFAFFIVRGPDPAITPIIAVGLGTVLSYFFAQHIGNGAASAALNALIERRANTGIAIDAAVAEAKKQTP